MLVVDRHALVAVHPLDLFHEVLLGLPDTLDLEEFLGIPGALNNGVTGPHLGAVGDLETSQALDQVDVLGAVIGDHGDLTTTTLVLGDTDNAGDTGQGGLALGLASLEELDDPGKTAGEVLAGHTTGVEGTHGQLGTGLADRLGGDHADRLADLDGLVGSQRHAVAGRRDADGRFVGKRRQHPHPVDGGVVAHGDHLRLAHDHPGGENGAVAQGHVVSQSPAEQPGLEVAPAVGLVGTDLVDPDATHAHLGRERVDVVDDELLGHVDQSTGQVARVGGPQGGIDETLTGTRRGDEVLQHRQSLTEVGLDGAGNHVTTWVGHQATHAGDLADLHHVSTSTRLDHHVNRVGLVGLQGVDHLVGHLGGRRVPDLDLHLPTLAVGDDPLPELGLDLLGTLLVRVEDGRLLWRGLDIVDGHRQTRAGGEVEADVLHGVERLGHHLLRVTTGQVVHDRAQLGLTDLLVDEHDHLGSMATDLEGLDLVAREGGVEEHAARRGGVPRGGHAVGRRLDELRVLRRAVLDAGVQVHGPGLPGPLEVVDVPEDLALTGQALALGGQVVGTDNHVLGRGDQRTAVGRAEHVVGRQHQHAGLGLSLGRQR